MNLDKLITMANQIGAFFAANPAREQAVADIAAHLRRTWDPRMRREIVACLAQPEGGRLDPLVREAVRCLTADRAKA
ncbi:formate dehydrogenase subunit delta [Burkholderiales bacterium]|jgi:formate dehydrogenase subunit delta|nr:MAG: formate dehydrogenase subunit delta [Burkholderiales bacterium]CAG0963884.1 formate dehydrogenase subunit delta [Burkholderiales bacterium]